MDSVFELGSMSPEATTWNDDDSGSIDNGLHSHGDDGSSSDGGFQSTKV
ncbi:MAG: hypothetical protein AAF202_13210 [Pseudomonadota bacterium]